MRPASLLVPHLEAPRNCPTVKNEQHRPHADTLYSNSISHTHEHLPLHCSLTVFDSFLGFQDVKNKAHDKRFSIYGIPTHQTATAERLFPSPESDIGMKMLQNK